MATERSIPNVLIFGAGAVGCLLGGMLSARAGNVTLICRPSLRQAIEHQGLRISSPPYAGTVFPRVIESVEQVVRPPDIVFLTMKCFDVEAVLPALGSVVGRETIVVTLQNGVGTEEKVQRALPEASLVAGSLTLSAEFFDVDRVATSSRGGGIALAPVTTPTVPPSLATMLKATSVPVLEINDFRSMKWSKLLLNIMGNATAAISGWDPSQIYRNRTLFQVERAMLLEALVTMRATGAAPVTLPGFPVPLLQSLLRAPTAIGQSLLAGRMSSGRGRKMPSLYLDITSNRRITEIAWLNGAIVRAGASSGIETPVNQRLVRIVEAITSNRRLRAQFRASPGLLSRNVALAMKFCPQQTVKLGVGILNDTD